MTTTVHSFNALLKNFIDELCQTFPEDATLAMYASNFEALTKANARKPLELFMEAVGPHAQLVMTKDPALFAQPIQLGADLDLKAIWDSPDLSDASRAAIWQYLHTLFLLASTVSALPPDMLQAIESLAHSCADKIQSGETDFATMTSMLMGGGAGGAGGANPLAAQLGGGAGGANPLAALLGGALDADQVPPSPHHRSSSTKKYKK